MPQAEDAFSTGRFSASELAREFGLSPSTVIGRLTDVPFEGKGRRKVWKLKDAAPALLGVDGKLDAHQEIAKYNRIRTEKESFRLATERGEFIPVDLVAERVSQAAAQAVAILDGIPAQCQRENPSLTRRDIDVIRRMVGQAKNRVAELHDDTTEEEDLIGDA